MPTLVENPANGRLPKALIDRWRRVPAAVAADQLSGTAHADVAIRPIRPLAHGERLCGSAITAWCDPETDYGAVHHAINAAEAGDVLVIAAGGRPDAAMIGELLSTAARLKGIAGVVADGAVRDSSTLAEWTDFPVFARWITPRGPSSMQSGAVNRPVLFGGVKVAPYDLVIAEGDGVAFVPHAQAEAKIAACLARVDAETGWEAELTRGRTTIDVFNVPAAKRA